MRHHHRGIALACLLAVVQGLAAQAETPLETPLDRYLKRDFPPPKPALQSEEKGKAGTRHRTWSFTSQVWQGKEWQHQLVVIEPKEIARPGTCLVMVAAGSPSSRLKVLDQVADRTKARAALLLEVPNQPFQLPGDSRARSEDDLLAETLLRAADTGDETMPLLFPMTRAVHAAMTVLREVAPDVRDFVLTGASKRGWTTYLAAATAGDRVRAIVPAVYDNLRVGEQMKLQAEAFGQHSEMLHDYLVRELMKALDTEEGRRLAQWIDPWTYRQRLALPKLLLLGTNDPYWAPQAASLYARELPGTTLIHYEPNRGHDMWRDDGSIEALAVFFMAVVDGQPLPAPIGAETPGAELWQATAATRDFRKSVWARTEPASASTDGSNGEKARPTVRAWRARVAIHGAGELWLWSPIVEVAGK